MQYGHYNQMLSLVWRRRFVLLLFATASGLVAIRILAGVPAQLRHAGAIICIVFATVAIWFLADAIGPWLAPANDSAARSLRTEAVSRAHSAVVWLAAFAWLYLQGSTAQPNVFPAVFFEPADLLLGVILIGLLLPIALVAWREPEGERTLGPGSLLRARFSGAEASGHRLAAGLMALSAGLLAVAAEPDRLRSPPGRVMLLFMLALIVAATVRIGWLLLLYDRRGDRDVKRGG